MPKGRGLGRGEVRRVINNALVNEKWRMGYIKSMGKSNDKYYLVFLLPKGVENLNDFRERAITALHALSKVQKALNESSIPYRVEVMAPVVPIERRDIMKFPYGVRFGISYFSTPTPAHGYVLYCCGKAPVIVRETQDHGLLHILEKENVEPHYVTGDVKETYVSHVLRKTGTFPLNVVRRMYISKYNKDTTGRKRKFGIVMTDIDTLFFDENELVPVEVKSLSNPQIALEVVSRKISSQRPAIEILRRVGVEVTPILAIHVHPESEHKIEEIHGAIEPIASQLYHKIYYVVPRDPRKPEIIEKEL